ncbi:MAG TPA: hypothetical protein VFI73_08160 [Candidatus Nitrosopolaris sp.]|nr:hypothetical protein [Candidatus Nitrosopolaris sp.]
MEYATHDADVKAISHAIIELGPANIVASLNLAIGLGKIDID